MPKDTLEGRGKDRWYRQVRWRRKRNHKRLDRDEGGGPGGDLKLLEIRHGKRLQTKSEISHEKANNKK